MEKCIPNPTCGPVLSSTFKNDKAELIYVEQMVPSAGDKSNIYWSCCDFHFENYDGCAGIQHQYNKIIDGIDFTRNTLCSIWGVNDEDATLPTEVTLTYKAKGLHSSHFGSQGKGLHTSCPMPWLPDQWYATVIRRWYKPGENVTRMAMFIFSYAENTWTHYVSLAIPGADIALTGSTCTAFLQTLTGDQRAYSGTYGQHFRMNKDSHWVKPLYYEATADVDPQYWKAELYEGMSVKLSAGEIFDNKHNVIKLFPCQSNKPQPAIPANVMGVKATYDKARNAIRVDWQISDQAAPQLAYRIEIHHNDVNGQLIYQQTDSVAEKRVVIFNNVHLSPGSYNVTVEIMDIFNQKSNLASHSLHIPA